MVDVSTMIALIKEIESADLTVHQERCTKVRNRNSSCRRCADACTTGALSLVGGALVVSADRCVGCGTCATVCPTEALEARNPTDGELLRACVELLSDKGHDPVIACVPRLDALEGHYDRTRVVEVRCLGRVDESLLVSLVALGARSITLLQGDCGACPNKKGSEVCSQVWDSFALLMCAWGHVNPLTITSTLPEELGYGKRRSDSGDDVNGITRRQLFTQMKVGMQRGLAEAVSNQLPAAAPQGMEDMRTASALTGARLVKVMRDGTLPHFIPNRRERLLDRLDSLGQPQAEYLDTRLWGHMQYDRSLCDSCRMCATFCPTGAIYKFDDPDGTMGIEHYPADCVQCRLCQDICPTNALTLGSKVSVKELLEGVIERHEMEPPLRVPSAPDSIIVAIKQLFNDTNINDRP
jgi:formate hydrogenlyase subunit 6/NADH:ubiquinone oxidoreductase subunit I